MFLKYGSPSEAGLNADRVGHVEQTIKQWVERGETPAAGILIARRGIIALHTCFGKSGPEALAPDLRLNTLFPLASITKTLTAACLLLLTEQGLLDLVTPVTEVIKEFTGPTKELVKIHHLLSHTSGLRDEDVRAQAAARQHTAPADAGNLYPEIEEMLADCLATPLDAAPGTKMSYCNYGYILAGEIVRRVSGQDLADFAANSLFSLLHMKNTFFSVPPSLLARLVRRADSAPGAAWLNNPRHPFVPYANSGAYSTMADMAVFMQMFLNGGSYGGQQILSLPAVRAMTANRIPGISAIHNGVAFPEASWGLGWNVRGPKWDDGGSLRSERAFGHGGNGGTYVFCDADYEILGVYFSVRGADSAGRPYYRKPVVNNLVLSTVV